MPYKSRAQAAYFNIHRAELERQGVDVSEWNRASKGMKLPQHVKKEGGRTMAGLGNPIQGYFARRALYSMQHMPKPHVGPIGGPTMGRGDKVPMRVAAGSYVLPADHVSALGQGNTQAGFGVLGKMFPGGPRGVHSTIPKPMMPRRYGGRAGYAVGGAPTQPGTIGGAPTPTGVMPTNIPTASTPPAGLTLTNPNPTPGVSGAYTGSPIGAQTKLTNLANQYANTTTPQLLAQLNPNDPNRALLAGSAQFNPNNLHLDRTIGHMLNAEQHPQPINNAITQQLGINTSGTTPTAARMAAAGDTAQGLANLQQNAGVGASPLANITSSLGAAPTGITAPTGIFAGGVVRANGGRTNVIKGPSHWFYRGDAIHRATGGRTRHHTGEHVDIMAADGEYVLHPHHIVHKFGDLKRGHEELDKWVMQERKKHIHKLKKLPPPAKK